MLQATLRTICCELGLSIVRWDGLRGNVALIQSPAGFLCQCDIFESSPKGTWYALRDFVRGDKYK